MKKKIVIIAALTVIALLVVLKMRNSKEAKKEPVQATGDEGTAAVEPGNKMKVIKANFVANTAQMDGVSVQPATGKGNII